jgi:regulator of protease activity HflC (stomatin/prohibitin superfamily)
MAAFVVPAAHADEWNKLTYVTFSQPVQLPNVTLPAGTYTIKLADIWSDRNVVQVFSKDRSKIYGTFLAISDKRLEPTGKPVIMFRETAKGAPKAVKAFFYPGDNYGKAFVYPRHEAQMIARANHETVYASDEKMSGETSKTQNEMHAAHVGQVNANGEYQAGEAQNAQNAQNEAQQAGRSAANAAQATGQAAANAAQGQGQAARNSAERAGQSARNSAEHAGQAASSGARATGSAMNPDRDRTAVGTSGQAAPRATTAPRRLPQTASPLELVELLSALSLAGAFGVRRARVRLARRD